MTFSDLGVSAPLVAVLAKHGIHDPFPIQTLVLPDALAGIDILGESPTGSGKTLAFGLPLDRAHRPVRRPVPAALVLVPTRELAGQIAEELEPLAAARGSGSRRSTAARRSRRRPSAPAARTSSSPRRAASTTCSRGACSTSASSAILVLDEADRMLDMGFRPQVDADPRARAREPPDDALLGHARRAASQSSPAATRQPLPRAQRRARRRESRADRARLRRRDGRRQARPPRRAARRRADGLALVFVRTKHGADRLARKLVASDGVDGGGDAREHVPERSASGRWPSSSRAACRRSSRPTSPPAASTSTTSAT